MDSNYFIYNRKKYIIKYENKDINIYMSNNGKMEVLTSNEMQTIKQLLNRKYNYIYDSIMLNNLVSENSQIECKEYIMNFFNWLESIIPKECKDNFYRNVKTLKTSLKLNISFSQFVTNSTEYETAAGYDTCNNSLIMNEEHLQKLWGISQLRDNPNDFYWKHYSQTLLHELSHMASSRYNSETKTSLSGFDRFPPVKEDDKNRGLTEGFTELISMLGVPGTVETFSGYYIEACLINQLMLLIGNEVFLKSYFSNLGVAPMQNKLNEIINNPTMSYNLFRKIELNYSISDLNEEQNVLSNIQFILLEYLNTKIELLLIDNKFDEISHTLEAYELVIIDSEKIKSINKNPQKFIEIDECMKKFNLIKDKFKIYLSQNAELSGARK